MGPAAGPLNRVGKSGATPTATVRSKDKACGGCNAEKPGSPQTPPRPGKWLVNSRRTKRTYKLLCDLPFKHDGVRGRADGRVARAEARSTISPRVTAQVGENSSRTEIRRKAIPSVPNPASQRIRRVSFRFAPALVWKRFLRG